MANIKKLLEQSKGTWNESKARQKEMFAEVPDGTYITQLQSASIVPTKNGDRLRIKREHIIQDGEFANSILYDGLHIGHEVGDAFIREWIERCGYEAPDEIGELPATVEAIYKDSPVCRVNVKNNDGFTNVQVLEVLETGGDEDESGEPNTAEECPYTEDEINKMKKSELIDVIEEYGLDTETEGIKIRDIREEIIEELGLADSKDSGDDEEVVAQEDDESGSKDDPDDELSLLQEFIVAQGLDLEDYGYDSVEEIEDMDELLSIVKDYAYTEDELTAGELALLERLEVADELVEKPKSKSKPKKRK